MKRNFIIAGILLVMLLSVRVLVTAQDTDCPLLVEEAIAAVGNACAAIGRNQICYGNNRVSATNWEQTAVTGFEAPGDTASIVDVASLATDPLNIVDNLWGVAVLALQANLPDTIPGQGVTFIAFGDTQMRSEDFSSDAIRYTAQVNSSANVRSGPGTTYAVIGSLQSSDEITVTGRSEAGDWLLIRYEAALAWVSASLLTVDGDIETLPIVEIDSLTAEYSAPMQAFRLVTGIGAPQCHEAPPDGVLVQAPTQTTVNFLINGIEVQLGSTVFLRAETEHELEISTHEGTVSVTSAGETRTVEPGFTVSTTEGQPPGEPQQSDGDELESIPLQLLPEVGVNPQDENATPAADAAATATAVAASGGGTTISVPGDAILGDLGWIDSGVFVRAGQTFTVSATGTVEVWPACDVECPAVDWIPSCDIVCNPPLRGPEGGWGVITQVWPDGSSQFPLGSAMWWSLVGRVGDGQPFEVGAGGTFIADSDGTIQFIINDLPDPNSDNPGAYTVTIQVIQSQSSSRSPGG